MKILVLNSGSSSQKACLYEIGEPLPDDPSVCLWEGKLEWNGRATTVKPADGNIERDDASVSSRKKALEHLLGIMCNNNGAGGASVSGIGAMVAVLGGIDALVFTAGAGENSPELRAAACEQLGFLGLKLDRKANAQPSLDQDIATGESQVRVLVIRAQEDWAIARECWKLARVLADWSDTAEPAGTFRS